MSLLALSHHILHFTTHIKSKLHAELAHPLQSTFVSAIENDTKIESKRFKSLTL